MEEEHHEEEHHNERPLQIACAAIAVMAVGCAAFFARMGVTAFQAAQYRDAAQFAAVFLYATGETVLNAFYVAKPEATTRVIDKACGGCISDRWYTMRTKRLQTANNQAQPAGVGS